MLSNLPPGVTDSMIEDQVSSAEHKAAFDILCDALEIFVDLNYLSPIVEALTQICYDKANHLRTNWHSGFDPDKAHPAADLWEDAGKQLEKLNIQV